MPNSLINNVLRIFASILLILALTTCGYQLRGTSQLNNFSSTVSINADDPLLLKETHAGLILAQVNLVTTTEMDKLLDTTTANEDLIKVTLTNTRQQKQVLLLDADGTPTHWRFTLSTDVHFTGNEFTNNGKLRKLALSEYDQVDLSSTSSSTNDRLEDTSWQRLYQRLAQRVVQSLNR